MQRHQVRRSVVGRASDLAVERRRFVPVAAEYPGHGVQPVVLAERFVRGLARFAVKNRFAPYDKTAGFGVSVVFLARAVVPVVIVDGPVSRLLLLLRQMLLLPLIAAEPSDGQPDQEQAGGGR